MPVRLNQKSHICEKLLDHLFQTTIPGLYNLMGLFSDVNSEAE